MKYRDNMSTKELHQLLRELAALDNALAEAHRQDEANRVLYAPDPDYCDEYAELRRAALNHRGEP